jgi:hypothetical protein
MLLDDRREEWKALEERITEEDKREMFAYEEGRKKELDAQWKRDIKEKLEKMNALKHLEAYEAIQRMRKARQRD